MASLPPSATSHTQPLPNRPTPAFAHCSLNASKVPNDPVIASAILPVGAPPAPLEDAGAIHVQNMLWFQCPPPLLRTAVRTSSGTDAISRHSSSTLLPANAGCFSSAALRLVT